MEKLYYYIGLSFISTISFFGIIFIFLFLIKTFIDITAKKFNAIKILLDYLYNRKEFKEYLRKKDERKIN